MHDSSPVGVGQVDYRARSTMFKIYGPLNLGLNIGSHLFHYFALSEENFA